MLRNSREPFFVAYLKIFELDSLEYRKVMFDLALRHEIIHRFSDLTLDSLFAFTRHGHRFQLTRSLNSIQHCCFMIDSQYAFHPIPMIRAHLCCCFTPLLLCSLLCSYTNKDYSFFAPHICFFFVSRCPINLFTVFCFFKCESSYSLCL